MSNLKKLIVNLSHNVYEEIDKTLEKDCTSSEELKEVVKTLVEDKKKSAMFSSMKKGYIEMAKINMEIAEMSMDNELNMLKEYENSLLESDRPDDDSCEKRRYLLC